MKKGFLFAFAIAAFVMLPTLSSFKVAHPSATKLLKFKAGESVEFTFHRPSRVLDASGAINATGKWAMDVRGTGSAFHCVNTMTFPDGVIVAVSNCNSVTMKGNWHIIRGTGAYEGVDGNGSLVMYPHGEEWEGTIR